MIAKQQTVTRAPGTDRTPMVKLANQLLKTMGFSIGTPIEVAYRRGVITLTIIENANKLQSTTSPFPVPTASSEAGAGAEHEYAGRTQPDPSDVVKIVPSPVFAHSHIFSRPWNHVSSQQDARVGSR